MLEGEELPESIYHPMWNKDRCNTRCQIWCNIYYIIYIFITLFIIILFANKKNYRLKKFIRTMVQVLCFYEYNYMNSQEYTSHLKYSHSMKLNKYIKVHQNPSTSFWEISGQTYIHIHVCVELRTSIYWSHLKKKSYHNAAKWKQWNKSHNIKDEQQ